MRIVPQVLSLRAVTPYAIMADMARKDTVTG
jgi:hypothetical protein